MTPPRIQKINPVDPEPEVIRQAATVIKQGGIVAFPTRCLYGLGADAFNPGAIERIIKIKQRPKHKPILVLIESEKQLELLVTHIPTCVNPIIKAFWPGNVTLVFEAKATLSDHLTAQTGKIGVRLSGHAVASNLVQRAQGPITGTSANLSGRPGCHRFEDFDPQIVQQLDLILDAGSLKGGSGSTVVDVTQDPPRVLREGVVSAKEIRTLLQSSER
jgi:L-threonylcarbamoyladenylate synthase